MSRLVVLGGAAFFEGRAPDGRTPLPVPVLLPHASRIRRPGVRVERTRRALPEAVVRYGVPCAPAELALLHEIRRAPTHRRAGVMVDMALAAGVVGLGRLHEVASVRRLPDAAAYALQRACAECRSPKESEMLQVWQAELGFPRRWRLGQFVPAPPLPDAEEAAVDAIMLEHYRSLE